MVSILFGGTISCLEFLQDSDLRLQVETALKTGATATHYSLVGGGTYQFADGSSASVEFDPLRPDYWVLTVQRPRFNVPGVQLSYMQLIVEPFEAHVLCEKSELQGIPV